MKLLFTIIISLLVCSQLGAQKVYQPPTQFSAFDYLPKTIIIKVKADFAHLCFNKRIEHPTFIRTLDAIGAVNLHKKFPFNKKPGKTHNEAGLAYADLSCIYELNYTSDLQLEKAIRQLVSTGILLYAEPHFVPKISYFPNDPLANATNQYHLQNIRAFEAWDINKGDSSVVIGITDTGIDFTHSDLFDNVKRNFNDTIDGVDNDGDGYIDNFSGWDLGSNDNDPTWQVHGHGVHVSGLAAAVADNGTGGAGVGFKCKFLPIKISDANGALIAAYEGIKYAADHGCHIINCSWGGGGASQFGQDMITYATINKNSLVICAAGNNNADGDFFPAAYNYVLCVGNTTQNDTKQGSSNYGYMVDVCAPGDQVSSTWPGNLYISSSGTSMSAPVVAGAAGIVKHHFPFYSALQIAERLKVTADNINQINPNYANKLGSGRINLFRALNDPETPSVVLLERHVTDHNDESYMDGDTLFITGTFFNYLSPTSALNVTVTPLSQFVTAINNTASLGIISSMASSSNSLTPFTFKLSGAIPINQPVDFEVTMGDGNYQSKQFFTLYINVDYINVDVNDVATTATSKGKLGYNQDAQLQGKGFRYHQTDLLYEGGLMIGCDTSRVSDCVRGMNGSASDADFGNIERIALQMPSLSSDFDTKSKFNDYVSNSPLSVEIQQNTFAWATIPNHQFVIWEYHITNKHAIDTLKNVYVGIFADWDIDGATFAQNRSAYDVATKMGYSFCTNTGGKYGGIKLLTHAAPPNFYAVDHVSGGYGGLDLANGFTTKEKYLSLSTNRLFAGLNGSGNDVINVMGTGPFLLTPGQSVTVAFAIIGADSLPNLLSAAQQAQIKYDGLTTTIKTTMEDDEWTIFPNPTNRNMTIAQKHDVFQIVEIYTLDGKLMSRERMQSLHQLFDLSNYSAGIYVIKLIGKNSSVCKKLVLIE